MVTSTLLGHGTTPRFTIGSVNFTEFFVTTTISATWSMAPVVEAVQAMRGVGLIVAVTVVAEVGDFSRFANPRQLMAYLGLVPSEHSSGSSVRRGGITKAGNAQARRVLIEGAWTYRMQARVSRKLLDRLEHLPQTIRDIAWRAQLRLCQRYRRLAAAGKSRRASRASASSTAWM